MQGAIPGGLLVWSVRLQCWVTASDAHRSKPPLFSSPGCDILPYAGCQVPTFWQSGKPPLPARLPTLTLASAAVLRRTDPPMRSDDDV